MMKSNEKEGRTDFLKQDVDQVVIKPLKYCLNLYYLKLT
jgi:hypothetical protein